MLTEEKFFFGDVIGVKVGGSIVGKPLMKVIYYFVDGLLIDTGSLRTRKSLDAFSDQNDIKQIALTHFHEDHAGNANFLHRKLDIPVFGSEITAQKLSAHVSLKPYERYIFGYIEPSSVKPFDGCIETEKYTFEPVHTPGHSADHTVFFEKSQGWVFSGDLFLSSRLRYWRFDEDMLLTIESIKKVLSLDFEFLFCGHNPKTKNAKIMLSRKLQQLESLIGEINFARKQGKNDGHIIKSLVKGNEHYLAKFVTLGDVSYKNMVKAAISAADRA